MPAPQKLWNMRRRLDGRRGPPGDEIGHTAADVPLPGLHLPPEHWKRRRALQSASVGVRCARRAVEDEDETKTLGWVARGCPCPCLCLCPCLCPCICSCLLHGWRGVEFAVCAAAVSATHPRGRQTEAICIGARQLAAWCAVD
jgi:hypothetical protein